MINLLSPEIKAERSYGRQNRSLLGYNVVLLLTALAIMGIMAGSLQFVGAGEGKLNEEIDNSSVKILSLESDVKPIEAVAGRLESANKISDLSVKFSELIPQIGAVLPEGVVLNALSLTGGKTDPLLLDVNMTSASLAPVLIRNLVDSDLFEAADVASIAPKGSGGTGEKTATYSFTASLTASFTGSAEIKRKAAAAEAAAAEAKAAAAAESSK